MAVKTKPQLTSTLSNNITDPLNKQNTASRVREIIQDIIDSMQIGLVSGTNIKTINSTTLLGSGNLAVQEVLVSGTNIKTINGNTLLGSGNLVIGSPAITNNYIPKGDGSSIVDGTWQFSTNDLLPNTTGSNLGGTSNRIGTGYINTINYATDLIFSENGTEKARLLTGGNFGIGTNNPSAKLHIISTTEQVRSGYDASNYWSATTSSSGLTQFNAVGSSAGFQFLDHVYNRGRSSAQQTNTAFGENALDSDTGDGAGNTAFGYNVLTAYVASSPTYGGNTGFGNGVLSAMVSGTSNTAMGNNAMGSSTSGILNIAIGSGTMSSSTGSNNIAIGDGVMASVSGDYNTSVGSLSSASMTSATRNVSMGYYALNGTTTGGYNVAIGNAALYQNVSGTNNTALGNNAGSAATGSNNLFLGNLAGGYQVAVSNRVFIDTVNRGSAAADITDALVYGITSATVADQRLRFNANVGIGGAATATSPLNISSLPTSAAGLASGDIWNNSGVLTIV